MKRILSVFTLGVCFFLILQQFSQNVLTYPPAGGIPITPAVPQQPIQALAGPTVYLPIVQNSLPADPGTGSILESFEGGETAWKVNRESSGSGSAGRSSNRSADGAYSARLAANSAGSTAWVRSSFSERGQAHTWNERPGTWYWQRFKFYVPSATISALGANGYLDLGGLWPASGGAFGWWLRVRQGGALSVDGFTADGKEVEFPIYASLPLDRWVQLELGLHSQAGPGVKRAFAFLLDGVFYGWYHQGNMQTETYDRAGAGIIRTNSGGSLEVFVDQWYSPTNQSLPGGPDKRPATALQSKDYRLPQGERWQIDWSTWANALKLAPGVGLYSQDSRLQSGLNHERMPDLSAGWGEIEIDWPKGTPPTAPNSYFGPMLGFRKEINREENLEVIPIGSGNGGVNLALEAWVNGGPQIKAQWPLPLASIGQGSHIPEPGDIIRVRWEPVGTTDLRIQASYYDASAANWHAQVINVQINISAVSGVNFNDGFHKASSITIDSPYYSIRRYQVGTLANYPGP